MTRDLGFGLPKRGRKINTPKLWILYRNLTAPFMETSLQALDIVTETRCSHRYPSALSVPIDGKLRRELNDGVQRRRSPMLSDIRHNCSKSSPSAFSRFSSIARCDASIHRCSSHAGSCLSCMVATVTDSSWHRRRSTHRHRTRHSPMEHLLYSTRCNLSHWDRRHEGVSINN